MSGPVSWPRRLLADERVRFLVVGGFNTGFGYLLFVAIELVVGQHSSYFISLYGAYLIAATVAFALHRRLTFQVHGTGSVIIDFLRYQTVSLVALAVNSLALPALVEWAGLIPIVAQLLIVVLTTTISYVGHKFFSFRRAPAETTGPLRGDEPG